MLKLRLLIAETKGFSPAALAELQEHFEVTLIDIQRDALEKALQEYDVFWFRLGLRIEAKHLSSTTRCRIIVCPATGLDHIDTVACQEKGIKTLSLRGETDFLRSVRATVELTIGLALALLRKIPQAVAHVQAGGWDRDQFQGQELLGKTVGIAGMGRLGKITAQYFQTFGCNVLAYDPIPFDAVGVEACPSLENLVSRAEIVSIHINYTAENHYVFNDALLSTFKKRSVLLNTARGALVDSMALIKYLESGHLAGAALDVIENEHQHQNSALIAYARLHDNLLITPHIGGNTRESFEKTELFLAKKLIAHVTAP